MLKSSCHNLWYLCQRSPDCLLLPHRELTVAQVLNISLFSPNWDMGHTQLIFSCKSAKVCTNRVDEGCNGLENKPLGVHLQGVLVSSLDAVEHLLLVTLHCGVLKGQQSIKCTVKLGRDANKLGATEPGHYSTLPSHCTSSWQIQP